MPSTSEPQLQAPLPARHSGRLKKALKLAAVVGGAIGVGVQFVPVKGIGSNPTERHKIEAPPEVEAILRKACFDCHSNETRWPFYARLAPGSWLMARDVNKGRSRMNFSEWGDLDEEARSVDKENAWEQIEDGAMPPWFYLPLHPDAILSDAEKAQLKAWLLAKPAKPAEPAPAPAPAAPPAAAPEPAKP